jgi:hypothetical protein
MAKDDSARFFAARLSKNEDDGGGKVGNCVPAAEQVQAAVPEFACRILSDCHCRSPGLFPIS